MEKIDLNNYEAYFLDFMEGTLSAEEKHDLFAFLNLHPALKAEMEADFGAVELLPERVSFEGKEALKIDEGELILTANTVDDIMIASVEGQLTKAHNQQLAAYVKTQNLEKTRAYYQATILKPDMSLVYAEKEKMKVKTGVVISLPFITRVAAIAAIGIILVTLAIGNWNSPGTLDNGTISAPVFASDAKESGLFDLVQKQRGIFNMDLDQDQKIPQVHNRPDKLENELIDQMQKDEIAVVNELPIDTAIVKSLNRITPEDIEQQNQDDFAREDFKNPELENPIEEEVVEEEIFAAVTNTVKREEPYKIVTDVAENLVNRKVEFTRDRNIISNDYVAYGFKLGKFEFERKKSK